MNIQSIKNKFDEVQCLLTEDNCDVLILVETWLVESETWLYEIKGYQALNSCRKKRGGGATIYIKDGIKVKELSKSDPEDNFSWICVQVGALKISAIYKPPNYNYDQFIGTFESILEQFSKNHLIVGDFNINLLDSENFNVKSFKHKLMQNNFMIKSNIGIEHATRVTADSKSLIDYVIVDQINSNCCSPITVEYNPMSDHHRLLFSVKEKVKIYKQKILKTTRGIDHKKLRALFTQSVLHNNINTFQELIDIINACKIKAEYENTIRCYENNEWVNKEILDLIKQRDQLYKKKCLQPANIALNDRFRALKNHITNKIKTLKNQYFRNKWHECGTDSKKQWRFINSLVKGNNKPTTIESLIVDNSEITEPLAIVNELNKHFSSVGKNIVQDINNQIINLVPDVSMFIDLMKYTVITRPSYLYVMSRKYAILC